MKRTYGYDDVLLIPKPSDVNSRDDVDISVQLYSELKLEIPIIASPMKGIVGAELCKSLWELGGIGILHRFHDRPLDFWRDVIYFYDNKVNFGFSVDTRTSCPESFMHEMYDFGARIVCLDVANGYTTQVLAQVRHLRAVCPPGLLVMSGCIASAEGYYNHSKRNSDLVRVGIGTGALCTTRKVTGIGYGQVTALMDCRRHKIMGGFPHPYIVADGGIHESGQAVKALAAGADVVMMGSWFAGALESSHNGIIYGMASRRLQEEYYHSVKSVEGTEASVEKTRPLKELIDEFTYGIKSAMTYVGARNLQELRDNAEFVEI